MSAVSNKINDIVTQVSQPKKKKILDHIYLHVVRLVLGELKAAKSVNVTPQKLVPLE